MGKMAHQCWLYNSPFGIWCWNKVKIKLSLSVSLSAVQVKYFNLQDWRISSMVICKLGEQSWCKRQVWIARVLLSGGYSSSALALVCLSVAYWILAELVLFILLWKPWNIAALGKSCVAVFQKRIGVQAFFFFMLVVRWLSIDNTYFPLRILYVILYILYVSLWAVLEAQCSWTDNFRTETESSCMILHLHKSCEGLPVPLSKQQVCFSKGKGTLFCLV